MAEPYDQVLDAFADVGERLVEYSSVWRKAIERNAQSAYQADDFLVDLQTLWGMSVRDAARVTSAFLAVLTPKEPAPKGDTPAPSTKAAPRKKTPGKRAAPRKQSASRKKAR